MTESQAEYQRQVQAIALGFARDLPDRLEVMEGILASLDPLDPGEEGLRELHRTVHQMAGGAGTFGYPAFGEACRNLEIRLQDLLEGEAGGPQGALDPLPGLLAALRSALPEAARGPGPGETGAAAGEGAPGPEASRRPPPDDRDPSGHREPRPEDRDSPGPRHASPARRRTESGARILGFAGDPEVLATLQQLGPFGFTFQLSASPARCLERLAEGPAPDLVLLELGPGDLSTLPALREVQKGWPVPVPIILLSKRMDLPTRLAAVRSGVVAYLPAPPDFFRLLEAVETALQTHEATPINVLVVEDDPAQAAHHAAVLQAAGMTVTTLTDPLEAMGPLQDWPPDLLLLDLYMPGCDGLELASVIRQQEAFLGLPIVFLSGERERRIQLLALDTGGDDFITKPTEPDHLVSIVRTRARRGRALQGQMVKDGLTGLLNHAAIMGQMEVEVARVRRHGGPLAFAMLDLDHFKQVNDTHGHPAGDLVLRSLARLLQQRLRRTDIIGRYGGEEFGIILPGADGPMACDILEGIRGTFAQLPFPFKSGQAHLTFSAGVSAVPGGLDPGNLIQAADEALYRSKRMGRNRVTLAG